MIYDFIFGTNDAYLTFVRHKESTMINQETIAILDQKNILMTRGYAQGDAEIIASEYYLEDAWVIGPEGGSWVGKDQILALYESVVGVFTWGTERVHLMETADGSISEFLIGTIYPIDEGEQASYKIQLVWTKQGNDWKCASQFFASGENFEYAA